MAFLDSLTLTKTLPCLAEPGKIIVIAQPSRNLDGAVAARGGGRAQHHLVQPRGGHTHAAPPAWLYHVLS